MRGYSATTLPLIRAIKEEYHLDCYSRRFPSLLYQGLFDLACGQPYDQVLSELGLAPGKTFDKEDFATALKTPANRARFITADNDPELEAIMHAPLAKWRVFLHPTQRYLVEAEFDGPAQVLGGAGTGKSVAALHRAKYLASKLPENQQVFFTTYTVTLIEDIKTKLQTICSYDEIQRIKVQSLDHWCRTYLKSQKLNHSLSYEVPHLVKSYWEEALTLVDTKVYSSRFLDLEWVKVIQHEGIKGLEEYLKSERKGRAKTLTPENRATLWPVFERYRSLLDANAIWEPADMFRTARILLENSPEGAGFAHILVDEIQDFIPEAIRMIRAMIPPQLGRKNDLFLVGDGHQNIYGRRVVLREMGIHTQGRKHRLRLNYRTPEETHRWAVELLKNQEICDLDGGVDSTKGYTSLLSGPEPELVHFASETEKLASVIEWFKLIRQNSDSEIACVCVKRNGQRDQLQLAMQEAGLPSHALSAEVNDISDPLPLRIATIHRVKGLEFDHVCILGYCEEQLRKYDPERQRAERCTFHVAATRARIGIRVIN